MKGRAPMFGEDCSDRYVASYADSHPDQVSESYRIDYVETLLVDALFRDYTLLYVGCGTGGFLRLYAHARRVYGIDYSRKMIEKCHELIARFNMTHVEAQVAEFARFDSERRFDIVHTAGIHGAYLPHTDASMRKVASLLREGGYGVFAITAHPRTLSRYWKRFKNLWRKKELLEIDPEPFRALLARNGFKVVIEMKKGERGDRFIYVCQRV
ncbi:MAG: class I SAM-dependent methyltransferase [Magnetococcales bacterium]|nr:class I SAM-dependent methyltransferase [Magnetococcales bacterium]